MYVVHIRLRSASQIPLLLALVFAGQAALADPTSPWLPGPDAVGDDTYTGFVDAPASGVTASASAPIDVNGWAVDQTAVGWAGIDQVQVVQGVLGQGGRVVANANIALSRPDVSQALGNDFFSASGFAATIPAGALAAGPATLSVYLHTPDKGWWYRQFGIQVQAAPSRAFSDDPLLVIEAPQPEATVSARVTDLLVHGFAIDRDAAPGAGVGGSGVSKVQIYLDGTRRDGTFIGDAQLGKSSRDATGFGQRFTTAGWEFTLHPNALEEEPHALFIYATSVVDGKDTLVIVPIRIGP
jgi:hypothetical protein